MEDFTVGKIEKEGTFFAVFDGHGGWGAAFYACYNLWDNIKSIKGFYSDEPEEIMEAIKEGFKKTQEEMFGKSPFCQLYTPRVVWYSARGPSLLEMSSIHSEINFEI